MIVNNAVVFDFPYSFPFWNNEQPLENLGEIYAQNWHFCHKKNPGEAK